MAAKTQGREAAGLVKGKGAGKKLVSAEYMRLIRQFPLRPLRCADDLDSAIAMTDSLTDRDDLTPDENDYLDVLSDLIERYESATEPRSRRSGVDAVRFLIDQSGKTQSEIADETRISRSTLTEILNGKRGISRSVMVALGGRFKVDPGVFLDDPAA